ncbi:MAG TPA: hypothetical protein VGU69_07255 [Rhizomicrobium sp.]|nr:hypothetical protein [Rhizomicrobium sp.]
MAQAYDFTTYDNAGIEGGIRRHQDQGKTDSDLYRALVEELARRNSKTLNVEKSIEYLRHTAKTPRTFVSYKDVALANGVDFSKVRYQMGKHLDVILQICHARRWPLLTSLCVKQSEVETGKLSGDSLKGFVEGARRLGIVVTDPEAFLNECQTACWKWAESN